MRKLLIITAITFAGLCQANAQSKTLQLATSPGKPSRGISKQLANRPSPTLPEKCGFAFMLEKAKAKGYNEAAFEAEINRLILRKKNEGFNFSGPVTLPVIFHVIYRNSDALGVSPNLSDSYFAAQIAQLNLDYANLSGSAYGVAADISIRFCLAVVDTAGRPLALPGIERINGQSRGWSNTNVMNINALTSYFDNTIKPSSYWDPYSYVNVWSAAMNNSGLLGYATFPSMSTLSGLDNTETNGTAGVVLNWNSIGSVAQPNPAGAPYALGRTLTHELGHFFGLRHIWGDATCGNDYCADTPPQDAETSGCPAPGTMNNCIPLVAKMFENYMDYSNDACLNTFTGNQASRCQTVMDNSPRRLSLISSKACQSRPGNAIGYATAIPTVVAETGNTGACPNTKSYSFNIYVSSAATGAATVTFSGGGTATLNKDYTISPASITYSNGDNSAKTVTVTIIDDQTVEPTETIVLGYSISGTGVVAGPDKQSMTIQVTDDDVANLAIDNTAPVKTLLTQNFDGSSSIPAGWNTEVYGDGISTPNQWVVSANGGTGFTSNAAHITEDVTLKPNTYNENNESDAYLFTPLVDASGLKDISISFKWKGIGEVGYDAGYIGYIPEGQAVTAANVRYFNTTLNNQNTAITANLNLPSSISNTKFYFVFNWYNDASVGTDPGFTLDDVTITGKALTIASTTDADTAFSQFNGQVIDYYSKSTSSPNHSRLIVTISNPSQDIGCVTATVPLAGTGLTPVTTNTGAYQRSDKVIQLTPGTANSTATYQITLYYTTAELAAWGGNVPNLKILKVKDGVSLGSTLTAANSQLFTPTVNDQRIAKGYAAFTINATGGFSQFLLVSPATTIPVSLLSFDAQAGKRNIELRWTTTLEINNKGFAIERSTDGIHFERIGWVNGKGNSNIATNYQYIDVFVQPGIIYYYRLKQTDLDSREVQSEVRQAKIKDLSDIAVMISPNPATDHVKLFVAGVAMANEVRLFNAQGQLVKRWDNILFGNAVELSIAGLSKGVFILSLELAEGTKTQKLIVE